MDEAGRGPLCGPVVAAAVVFPVDENPLPAVLDGIDDSKRLSPSQRLLLADRIRELALATGIGLADSEEIDRLNIRQATLLAMSRAVHALRAPNQTNEAPMIIPAFVLIDGRDVPTDLPAPARAVVKGDQLSVSIAAASILAKTHRDALMEQWALRYPGYGWERNAGYPTAEHLRALESLGVTPIHRRSYAPVARRMMEEAGRNRSDC